MYQSVYLAALIFVESNENQKLKARIIYSLLK